MNDEDRCPGTNQNGERCGHPTGWGMDGDAGPCKFHAGTSADGQSHERNQNAVTHGLYAEHNTFYQKVLDDALRALVDNIFSDYVDSYRERHGEPTTGHEAELFRIAVSYAKHVHADNWALERPASLKSGHPLVDQETHYSESGEKYHRYKETVVAKGQARLSRDRRAWLKDLGLLEDPDSSLDDDDGLLLGGSNSNGSTFFYDQLEKL